MSELSTLHEEVRSAFMTNYTQGGIEACRAMVADLKREADAISAVSDGTNDITDETIAQQEELGINETLGRIEMVEGVTGDCITALSRHSFALHLLRAAEERLSK